MYIYRIVEDQPLMRDRSVILGGTTPHAKGGIYITDVTNMISRT